MELAKPSKVNLIHSVRLKTLEGRREVFWYMSAQRDGYSFTVRRKLLDVEVGREKVAFGICDLCTKIQIL